MPALLHSIRGTVHGVVRASRHLLWYADWCTRGAKAARSTVGKA